MEPENQLLQAIKRSSLRSIVNCYIEGVNANLVIDPNNGDNPIHIAVRVSSLYLLKEDLYKMVILRDWCFGRNFFFNFLRTYF